MAMKKGTKGFIIVAVVIVVIAAALGSLVWAGQKALTSMASSDMSTTQLERMDLSNTISVTGNIQSASSKKVYLEASGAGKAAQVNVAVGDTVAVGDVLCVFDTEDLQKQFEKTQIQSDQSAKNADINLDKAQTSYSSGKIAQDQSVRGAETNLKLSQDKLDQAQESYDKAIEDYNSGNLALELQVDGAYSQAQYTYSTAKAASNDLYLKANEAKAAWDQATDPEEKAAAEAQYNSVNSAYIQAQSQTDMAKAAFDTAKKQFESKDDEVKSLLDDYEKALSDAKDNYNNADKALSEAKKQRQLALSGYASSIDSAKIAADQTITEMTMEDAQENIDKCTITATMEGTITAVYVTEDEASSIGSLLFIIEDLSDLEIVTTVKEYDIASLAVSMPAQIKTDATGDMVYEGSVKEIGITAKKDTIGNTINSTNAEFEVKLAVDPGDGKLMAGMNGRATITINSTDGVLAVNYSSVGYDDDGSAYVMVAKTNDKNITVPQKVYVTLGVETDFEVEIISDELQEGDMIYDNPETAAQSAVTAG